MRKIGKFLDNAIMGISLELYRKYEIVTFSRIQPNIDPIKEFFQITGNIAKYPGEAAILIRENCKRVSLSKCYAWQSQNFRGRISAINDQHTGPELMQYDVGLCISPSPVHRGVQSLVEQWIENDLLGRVYP